MQDPLDLSGSRATDTPGRGYRPMMMRAHEAGARPSGLDAPPREGIFEKHAPRPRDFDDSRAYTPTRSGAMDTSHHFDGPSESTRDLSVTVLGCNQDIVDIVIAQFQSLGPIASFSKLSAKRRNYFHIEFEHVTSARKALRQHLQVVEGCMIGVVPCTDTSFLEHRLDDTQSGGMNVSFGANIPGTPSSAARALGGARQLATAPAPARAVQPVQGWSLVDTVKLYWPW